MNISIVTFIDNCSACQETTDEMPVIYTYITFVMVVVNILGNIFAVVILSDPVWNKSVLTTILKAISYFEIFFNLLMFISMLCQMTEPLKPFLTFGLGAVATVEVLLLICDALIIGFQMARNWSVTILALFRYDMVCRSKTVRRGINDASFFSNDILPGVFICLILFCVGLAIPRIFEETPMICSHSAVICYYTMYLRQYNLFQYGYLGVVMFVFQSGGPIIITSCVSLLVIHKIQYQHKLRNRQGLASSNRFQKSQRNPGTLVLAVCITFMVLEFPSFFSKLAFFVFENRSIHLGVIPNLLIYLDSSLNLLIYLVSNKTFRRTSFNRILCKKSVDNWEVQTVTQTRNLHIDHSNEGGNLHK